MADTLAAWLRQQREARGWTRREMARQLIEAAVGHMRAQGAQEITLWVTEGNDRARAFYERAGFHATGKRQPVRPGEPGMEQEMSLAVGG